MIPKKAYDIMGKKCSKYGLYGNLNETDIHIFELLLGEEKYYYQPIIAKRLRRAQSTISKRLKIWVTEGIIKSKTERTKVYYLNQAHRKDVMKLVSAYRKGKNSDLYSLHRSHYIAPLNDLPKKLQSYLKRNGWKKSDRNFVPAITKKAHEGTVKFEKTTTSWKAHFFVRGIGETPLDAEFHCLEKVYVLKGKLEHKFAGLVIGPPYVDFTSHGYQMASVLDQFATTAYLLGIQNKYEEVEASWLPEWEEKGINAVESMEYIYNMRRFCKNKGLTEPDLAKIWEQSLRRIYRERISCSYHIKAQN